MPATTSTLVNPQPTSVWQSWLAPLELVKDKQSTGMFDVFDQHAFTKNVDAIFAGKQAKSEQRAALLELVKTTLATGRSALETMLVSRRARVRVGSYVCLATLRRVRLIECGVSG